MKNKRRKGEKVTELVKGKPRREEEKFFLIFSGTQLNSILLIVLSATFLVQGIVRYLEITNNIVLLKPWLLIVISSLAFLVLSVFIISVGGIISSLKYKRRTNIASFISFVLGFLMFLSSLFFLLFNI